MKTCVSDLVRSFVGNFPEEIARCIIDGLESSSFPRCGDNIERLQIAVIILSKGDLDIFREVLIVAREDWRDVLIGAGLAGTNWREVIASSTFRSSVQ